VAKEETKPATVLEYDLADDTTFPSDTYSITVTAVGVKNATTDSPASAVLKVQKTVAPETPFAVDVTGVANIGSGTLSDKSASSYTYEITGNTYGGSYAYFQYTFTGGNKLSDCTKITFKITGKSGDIGYKNVGLFASKTVFSQGLGNYIGNAPDATNPESLNYDLVSTRSGSAIGPQYNMAADTEISASVNLNPTEAAKYNETTAPYFTIFYNSGNGKFKISDVKFIKAEPNTYVVVE